MEIALAVILTLFSLLLIGGGIAFAVYGILKQNSIHRSIDDGFALTGQRIIEAAIAIDQKAQERQQTDELRLSVWIPPNEGCEICGSEAVVVCSRPGIQPIWLCAYCNEENEDFD